MAPPLSLEQLTRQAGDFQFDVQTPLRYWLRTAGTLLKEARIYEHEGNDQQAFLLYFRHAQLVLSHLPTHPEAKDDANRQALKQAQNEVKTNLAKMEQMKPGIRRRHQRWVDIMRQREQTRKELRQRDDVTSLGDQAAALETTGLSQPLQASQNRELAVRLAQGEFIRRAEARAKGRPSRVDAGDDLADSIRQVGMQLGARKDIRPGHSVKTQPSVPSRSLASQYNYNLPSIPNKIRLTPDQYLSPQREPLLPEPLVPAPAVPEKLPIQQQQQVSHFEQPPPIPGKVPHVEPEPATRVKPSDYTFQPSAYLENGTPLRTIFISPDLRRHFLSIAHSNTTRNLETCGILCGTLISNAFFISRLVIPEQVATSDTCEMVNESAIFDYCDSEDLMVLGWIHTHPTQTCFMSSRDLHTHSGFQVMLPESIALVCAPSKDPDWGVFRLTDPPGLKHVLNCTKPGIFHPHSEVNLYTDALRPGHVFEARGLDFEVVDLRPGH